MNCQTSSPVLALERKPARQPDYSRRKKSPGIPLDQIHFQHEPKVRLSPGVLVSQISLAREKYGHGSPAQHRKQPANPETFEHRLASYSCMIPAATPAAAFVTRNRSDADLRAWAFNAWRQPRQ